MFAGGYRLGMPDERKTVIPFYALELGHLIRPVAQLVVTCGACRQSRVVEVLPLVHRLGPTYGVKGLERRLRCQGCGHRGFASVRAEWL